MCASEKEREKAEVIWKRMWKGYCVWNTESQKKIVWE